MKYKKLGLIGRFKPLHNGCALLLEEACKQSEKLIIGIGSCNKYDIRNPFTADETEGMIRACLKHPNYDIIHIPDFGHIHEYESGKEWAQYVKNAFGNLDAFVTGNGYVYQLLSDYYKIIHPDELVPKEKQVEMHSTKVRIEMAKGEDWRGLVPLEVAEYLAEHGLVERFRQEYGQETLKKTKYKEKLSASEERDVIIGGYR